MNGDVIGLAELSMGSGMTQTVQKCGLTSGSPITSEVCNAFLDHCCGAYIEIIQIVQYESHLFQWHILKDWAPH